MLFDLAEIALRNILSIFGFVPKEADERPAGGSGNEGDPLAQHFETEQARQVESDRQFQLGVAGFRTGHIYNEMGHSDLQTFDNT